MSRCTSLPLLCLLAIAWTVACAPVPPQPMCGDGVLEEGEHCPLLEGPADAPAVEATRFYDDGGFPPPDEISEDPKRGRVLRTELEIWFVDDASIGQVNQMLTGINARTVSTLQGVPMLGVRIPDPKSLEALDELVARVEADPIVRFVRRGFFPTVFERPYPFDEPPHDTLEQARVFFGHHVAVRAPAAWNVRRLLPETSTATVIVSDFFGGGPPGSAFDIWDRDDDYGRDDEDDHGYHVLGIIAAKFDAAVATETEAPIDFLAQKAVGIYPSTVSLRVVDGKRRGRDGETVPSMEDQIINLVRNIEGWRAVVNTSWGYPCSTDVLATIICSDSYAPIGAYAWIQKVRRTGLENRFLHISAAGNIETPRVDPQHARYYSAFNAAALLERNELIGNTPPLANTLVVENGQRSGGLPVPDCLDPSSAKTGSIAGIGKNVWSTPAADGGREGQNPFMVGTSMAAPQVAGLAAYVWSLAEDLTVGQLRSLLYETTQGTRCPPDKSMSPVIDAYAAVLSIDGVQLTPSTAKIRHEILNAQNEPPSNDKFDEHDLESFLKEYHSGYRDAKNPGTAKNPAKPDFSRYDLNGDGFTGGKRRAEFDLDRVDSTQYGASKFDEVTQKIEGKGKSFNEERLTDMQILCYYAYSPLYEGDRKARKKLIAPLCGRIIFTFDQDLDGWSPGAGRKELDRAKWLSRSGKGVVMLDGSDFGEEDKQPNAWISKTIDLPKNAKTLSFDTSAHNKPGADSALRVILMDASGKPRTLQNWQILAGPGDDYLFVQRSLDISDFAGQRVTIYFEQDDNGQGNHEQRYLDNISIESDDTDDSPGDV